MAAPLLTTKFYIPPVRLELVSRQHLIERLNAGLKSSLALISAPAGYGKTTLLSDWSHRKELTAQVIWISLDKADNDPIVFWDYFITALGKLRAGVGENASTLLHLPKPPPIEAVLTTLINEISMIQDDFALVLDDYHVIESQPIHGAITFLLDHLPPQMHLVIATRADPPLPLALLRGRGSLVEIRTDDLRFTPDEAVAFLNQVMGLNLSEENVLALETRTEGWIAGLQMAVLSMQGRKDIPGFIKAFTGSNRYILDYLIEEVFQRQPADVQDFLLKTSILEQLTAPLCDFVTERDDSRKILPVLERANLFIVPLDESRQWYRYQRLFADLLQHQLDIVSGMKDVSLIHARASEWYEANGFPADAIHHAITAQDWERAATLVHNASETLLKRGEVTTLLGWIQALPDEVVRDRPQLCSECCWTLILTGQFSLAESFLEHVERNAEDNDTFFGEILVMRAYIARSRGDNPGTIELSKRATLLLPQDNIEVGSILALNLGIAQWHCGNLVESEQAITEAYDKAQQSGNDYVSLTAVSIQSIIYAAQGKLHQAADSCRHAIGLAEQSPAMAGNYITLGALLYEWNELEAAIKHVLKGIELSQLSGNLEFQSGGYRMLARIRIARNDATAAYSALQKADEFYRDKKVSPLDGARTAACYVLINLAQSNISAALDWAARITEEVDSSSFYPRLYLTQARLLLAQGNKRTASEQLAEKYEIAVQSGLQYGVVETRAMQALAASTPAEALAFLADALELAQPEGYIRTFIDKGEPMAELLNQAASQGITVNYVSRLLSAFKVEKETKAKTGISYSSPDTAIQTLTEPLSERELEVLRLLVAGLSNREISKRLIVSIGTVKTHVHNILNKMNVSNRTQATTRARELNLI